MRRCLLLLLLCFLSLTKVGTAWAAVGEPEYTRLQAELQAKLAKAPGEYGLCLIDLASRSRFGINEEKIFHAASTVKIPINLYLAQKFANREIDPAEYLTYEAVHYEGGTGYLHTHSFGNKYQIARLSRDSIVYSDNVATNIILSRLGRKQVKDFMRSLGAEAVENDRNTTCPKDMALMMEALVLFADEHPAEGGLLLEYLRTSVFRDGIPAAALDTVPVANKIGFWPASGTYNDVAYVEHPARPYVLAIYSKDTPGREAAFAHIRRLASVVYSYQDNPDLAVNLNWNGDNLVLADQPVVLRRSVQVEVPVRALASAVPEIDLGWNPETKEITIHSIETGREASLAVDGGTGTLLNGSFYTPLRHLLEALGYQVDWSAENLTATVTGPYYAAPGNSDPVVTGSPEPEEGGQPIRPGRF
ncbi:MAG: serine hydrolase [Clostridia bacterium]|nr:serine hydrolase [Clostridia bacterium]MDQ7791367.1 serine hydrolase [Clostridia bacterium]